MYRTPLIPPERRFDYSIIAAWAGKLPILQLFGMHSIPYLTGLVIPVKTGIQYFVTSFLWIPDQAGMTIWMPDQVGNDIISAVQTVPPKAVKFNI